MLPDAGGGPDSHPAAQATGQTFTAKPVARRVRPYQHGKASPTARVSSSPVLAITRDQEYAFIREDLRRLLATAGILILVMIALLFVIDR